MHKVCQRNNRGQSRNRDQSKTPTPKPRFPPTLKTHSRSKDGRHLLCGRILRKVNHLPAAAATSKMRNDLASFPLIKHLFRKGVQNLRVRVNIEFGVCIHGAAFSWNASD
jgi:hypothetical protein